MKSAKYSVMENKAKPAIDQSYTPYYQSTNRKIFNITTKKKIEIKHQLHDQHLKHSKLAQMVMQ